MFELAWGALTDVFASCGKAKSQGSEWPSYEELRLSSLINHGKSQLPQQTQSLQTPLSKAVSSKKQTASSSLSKQSFV